MDIKSIHQPFSMVSKTMTEQKENTKKTYRYTKQLIKLAIENGYTNHDIAEKAGLSPKSTALVSRWRNGKALATDRQMNYFIKEFEHLLKRKMEHLFYELEEFEKDGNTLNKVNYFKISGEIILKHHLRSHGYKKNITYYRIIIIKNSDNVFYVLHQKRNFQFSLYSNDRQTEQKIPLKLSHPSETASWITLSRNKLTNYEQVIDSIDNFSHIGLVNNHLDDIGKSDLMTLPFILRENLLKLGYSHKDIEVLE